MKTGLVRFVYADYPLDGHPNAVPAAEAEGAVLAHSLAIGSLRLKKGRVLGAAVEQQQQGQGLAGAAAGALAWAVASAIYAFHCFDDSPLFVLVWYPMAAIPVVAAGYVMGSRLLRW